MTVPGRLRVALVALVATLAGVTASGQQSWRDPDRQDEGYDGRLRFVRLRWEGGGLGSGRRGMSNAWNHDYPGPSSTSRGFCAS